MSQPALIIPSSHPVVGDLTRKPVRRATFPPAPAPIPHPGQIRLAVAGGQAIARDGLRRLLGGVHEFQVVGEAADNEQTLQLIRRCSPDVLLLDLPLENLSELDILRQILAAAPAVRVLLLAGSLDKQNILLALQYGARGVLVKDSASSQMLFESIRVIKAGNYWIGRQDMATLIAAIRESADSTDLRARRPFGLTARELEIIGKIVQGYTNSDVAQTLSLSIVTVKHHLSHIFDKLGVGNRLELALFAINHHLVRDHP